ncbi:hypothetical protein GCM10019016_001230 [Streptomyces prasinosporus]|uniref:Transposase n=1 Tax=Streptomyces prasinosporus TaxID=68256 RepID=A0ABP6TE63_9ACTN
MRFVERKAQNLWSLLRQGLLWANSPVLSPVRLEARLPGAPGARGGGSRRYVRGVDASRPPARAAVAPPAPGAPGMRKGPELGSGPW